MSSNESLTSTLHHLESALANRRTDDSISDLADLLTDDFIEFGQSGRKWTKQEVADELLADKSETVEIDNFQVQTLTDQVALATYTARSGSRASHRSSIWVHRNEQWLMLFHQATAIPPAQP